jgi:hypothetical protein
MPSHVVHRQEQQQAFDQTPSFSGNFATIFNTGSQTKVNSGHLDHLRRKWPNFEQNSLHLLIRPGPPSTELKEQLAGKYSTMRESSPCKLAKMVNGDVKQKAGERLIPQENFA